MTTMGKHRAVRWVLLCLVLGSWAAEPDQFLASLKNMLTAGKLPADVWGDARGGPLDRWSLDMFVDWAAQNLTQQQRHTCAEWGPVHYCHKLQCIECWDVRYKPQGISMNATAQMVGLNLDSRLKNKHRAHAIFNNIIATQVFEHVHRPVIAAQNIYNLLQPGGHVLVTVPFLQRYHELPADNFRFTVGGAIAVFEAAGLQLQEGFVFGDMATVIGSMLGFGRSDFGERELQKVYMPLQNWKATNPGKMLLGGVTDFYIQTLLLFKRS